MPHAKARRELRLGDVIALQRGTTYKSSQLGGSGPILLGLASIRRNGGFREDSLKSYGGNSPDKLLVHPGELYASLKDVTQAADLLGAVARLPIDYPKSGRLTQDTVKLQFLNTDTSESYIYWLLRTPQYREYCRSHSTGTTNLGLSREDFLALLIPEATRWRLNLVKLLDSIEAKLSFNSKIAESLESTARLLFKSWFVDFDPVRAKAESRDTGLLPEIASFFPSSVETAGIGDIPSGWRATPIDRLATFLNGIALQRFPAETNDSLPAIKIAQLRAGTTSSADRISKNIPEQYIVYNGDVLFSWSGSLECVIWTGGTGALNQHLFKVTSNKYPKWLYYFAVKEHLEGFREIAAGKATTMGHIQRHHLSDASIAIPKVSVISQLDRYIAPFLDAAVNSRLEAKRLATLRDILLPKLIAGETPKDFAERGSAD